VATKSNNFNNFPENQLTNGSMATLGMMYHARGGLVWGQVRGVIWSQEVCITYWSNFPFSYLFVHGPVITNIRIAHVVRKIVDALREFISVYCKHSQ